MLRTCVLAAVTLAVGLAAQAPKSPEQFLGHRIGADGTLVTYSELDSYWHELAEASPRMQLENIGRTAYGQVQWLAVLSSPANLARRDELRVLSERLAHGTDPDEQVARTMAADGRAVVWIDGGMHATETLAAQQLLELVWQLVSRDDDEVRRILDQVVVLVCPTNPDGMEMVSRAYRATGRVGGLPVLYQKYCGHDNNRDYYTCNTVESRNVAHVLYHEWFPQVVYNQHQSAPHGTILFTPPFRSPFNYQFDPLIVRGIDVVAAHMNERFALEGKPGVISRGGASYSTWWNGGLRTTAYFHNMIGILTEAFGRPDPTPISQTLDRRLPNVDYPDPVPTQIWHARQTIDYLQTANFAILDYVSRYRQEVLFGMWRMARNSIERGATDHWTVTPRLVATAREREHAGAADDTVDAFEDPMLRDARAYVLPADQPDAAAATRLVRALRRTGVEVWRARHAVELPDHSTAPPGSYVIPASQAFRPHVRDMLEPQWHPDDRDGGDPVKPYDSAGWTLSMQMDVRVVRVRDALDCDAQPIDDVEVGFPPGAVTDGAAGWLVGPRDGNQVIAVERLRASGVEPRRLLESTTAAGRKWPAGTMFVPAAAGRRAQLTALAVDLGLDFVGTDRPPEAVSAAFHMPRVGVFVPWGGGIDTGWTEWVLERAEVPFTEVFGARLEAGDLEKDFDVLIVLGGLPAATRRGRRDAALQGGRPDAVDAETIGKLRLALPPFEDWSTLEARAVRPSVEKAIPALRRFVESGGRLLAFGNQAERVAKHFELPVRTGVWVPEADGKDRPARRDEFFVPASLLWADVETTDPLCFGMSSRQAVMFRRGPVFEITDRTRASAPVNYVDGERPLASGWAIGDDRLRGKAAVVRVPLGDGEVVLFGLDAIFRGQPTGTHKLLFNAILSAGSR